MKAVGSVFYKDDYETTYKIDWETVGNIVDITTITETPYVWGSKRRAYKNGYILFRLGMVSVQRQLIKIVDHGYEIVAEGVASYEDYIAMNYACGRTPKDNFLYHLNNVAQDEVELRALSGPHWTDPNESDDTNSVWADVGLSGTEELTAITAGSSMLTYMDVWPDLA